MDNGLKIDIGCGNNKREGFIGLDYAASPCVDYVLDLTNDPLPFEDHTVSHVFSAHFLEHIHAPNHIFQEIGRVCCDGAKIEVSVQGVGKRLGAGCPDQWACTASFRKVSNGRCWRRQVSRTQQSHRYTATANHKLPLRRLPRARNRVWHWQYAPRA